MTAAALPELLDALGGTLALSFIVAIALGIAALTVLFFGSAVVVLERFARALDRPLPGVVSVATAAFAGGLLLAARARQEAALLPAEPDVLPSWPAALGGAGAVVLASAAALAALRWLRPRTLAAVATVVVGGGYALLVGAGGDLLYAAAPPVAVAAFGLARRLLRRGRSVEGSLVALAFLSLLPGVVLALAASRPLLPVARLGAGMLSAAFAFVVLGLLPLAIGGFVDLRRRPEWFIAARYLVAKRRQTFISLITMICVLGVAVGVWLIITVLSVMNGFERMWEEEVIRNRAHLTVYDVTGPMHGYREVIERVERVPGVVAVAPFLEADGMVRGPHGEIVGIRLRGVDPDRVAKVSDLARDLVAGTLAGLRAPPGGSEGEAGILVGSRLAGSLGLSPGDPLVLISPFGGPPTPFGPAPRLMRFRVAGIFESTFFQMDESFAYTTLEAAREFRRVGDVVDGLEVRVTDHLRSRAVGLAIARELAPPYATRDWKELFPAFFQALKTEQVMMFLLLTMIMVVAAFVIVATLVMMIMEKSSDIAILKAMGARDSAIERIFAIEGTLIGLFGTALGVVAGLAVTDQLPWIQEKVEAVLRIDVLPATVYQFSTLPSEVDPVEVLLVAAIAMVLSMGATLLPSRQGARLDPAEALRRE